MEKKLGTGLNMDWKDMIDAFAHEDVTTRS